MSEPTVFLLASGALLLSDIVDNQLRQRTYYGYTRDEAIHMFKEEVVA
jgi:regulation of enolase protein 1 (concanavalin A-like superfamily)